MFVRSTRFVAKEEREEASQIEKNKGRHGDKIEKKGAKTTDDKKRERERENGTKENNRKQIIQLRE